MKNKGIIGALIGLSGAVSNNGKSEETDRVVREALLAPEDTPELLNRIREEKYRISPGCRTCSMPCGNTSDYDMEHFLAAPEEKRQAKLRLIDTMAAYLRKHPDPVPDTVYRGVSYLGFDLPVKSYDEIIREIRDLRR